MKSVLVLLTIFVIFFSNTYADNTACSLPKEIGPCRKSDAAFYHNVETKQCDEFLYGGCLGNENRFETKEECEKACLALV